MGVLTEAVLEASAPLAAAAPNLKPGESLGVVLAVAVLSSSVIAGLITAISSSVRTAATARRDGYALAVKTLIARAEYPYRVRRRVSDDPEVIAALVSRGNDLQEQLAACRTWVASEHPQMGRLYEEALAAIDLDVKPATRDAWGADPISAAAGMNLDGWGPGDPWPHLRRLEDGIAARFGLRRVFAVPRAWARVVVQKLRSGSFRPGPAQEVPLSPDRG